jgi:hypothetical protein
VPLDHVDRAGLTLAAAGHSRAFAGPRPTPPDLVELRR